MVKYGLNKDFLSHRWNPTTFLSSLSNQELKNNTNELLYQKWIFEI